AQRMIPTSVKGRGPANPFTNLSNSIDKTLHLLPQPLENPRLGDQDGIDRHPQFGRNLGSRSALANDLFEGLPGGRLELQADRLHERMGDMAIVLQVPGPSEWTVGILELPEGLGDVVPARCLGATAS